MLENDGKFSMRRASSRNYASVRAAVHKHSGRMVEGNFFGSEQAAMIFRHENYNLSGGGTRETFISVSKYKSSGSRYFH